MGSGILALAIALYIVGLLLIVVEAHIPGFGIPGISGLISLMISIYLVAQGDIFLMMVYLLGTVILIFGGLWVLYNSEYGRKHLKTFFLFEAQSREKGYVSSENFGNLIGKEGVVVSTMRPAGMIKIEGRKYDAVSEGEFIEINRLVIVDNVEGRKILVKPLDSIEGLK